MRILVIAPHNDDEILGLGGTIRKHILAGNEVYVCEVTAGAHAVLLQNEAKQAHERLGISASFFLNLPVGELRNLRQCEINDAIGKIVNTVSPELVYIPFIGDMHMDHREVTESAMVALRPLHSPFVKAVYMYETLSETGWNLPIGERVFQPNVWVDITETINDKLEAMDQYQSQLLNYPHPRSKEAIIALAKYRGSTVGVAYAESFMLVRKID